MFPNKDSSFLILGAGGFVGSYIRGLCDVLDLRYIGTSKGGRDGLIPFDAGDNQHWAKLEQELETVSISAIIDLVAPNVSPVRRREGIQPSLYAYPDRLILLADRLGTPIVHVGTDLPISKEDTYGSFKDVILRSLLSGGKRVTVVTAPRLIGVGLSQHFLAGSMVKSALEERPISLDEPDVVRGFLSVRTIVQEIICVAMEGHYYGRPSFQAEREYLSTAAFYSKVLSIYARLKAEGTTFRSGDVNPADLKEWTRQCWKGRFELSQGDKKDIFEGCSYTLDEEIEAMFKHGRGG